MTKAGMYDTVLHYLKYGIILIPLSLVLTGCATTPRVPMLAINKSDVLYLSYLDTRPAIAIPIPADDNGSNVTTKSWTDVITAVPEAMKAYEKIRNGSRTISVEFYVSGTNNLSDATVREITQAFKAITEK